MNVQQIMVDVHQVQFARTQKEVSLVHAILGMLGIIVQVCLHQKIFLFPQNKKRKWSINRYK